MLTLAPGRRVRKPLGRVALSGGSRLARDLLFAALYNEQAGVPLDITDWTVGSFVGTAGYGSLASECGILCNGDIGDYVTFGNITKLKFTNASSFTIISAIIPTNLAIEQEIMSKSLLFGSLTLNWGLIADKLKFLIGNAGLTLGEVYGALSVPADALSIVACRRDVTADTLALYVNGMKDTSVTDASTGAWTISTGEWASILTDSLTNGFDGLKVVDLVFGRALTDAEIADVSTNLYALFEWEVPLTDTLFVPITLTRDGHMPVEWLATLNRDGHIPVEWLGNMISYPIPIEWRGGLDRDGHLPIDLQAFLRSGRIPVEFSGQPSGQLLLIWRIIKKLNVPLELQWNIVREALSQGLTLSFNVKQALPSLQLRWRVLPPIQQQFVDNDIHNPTASVVKTP